MPTQGAIVNPSISTKFLAAAALAVAALAAASAAHARSDVYISVGVRGAPVYAQPVPVYEPAPVYYPAPVYQPVPVYTQPAPVYRSYPQVPPNYERNHRPYHHPRQYRQPTHWDHDGDGIPNRHDPVYNPRWDRDGDGVPNWHDRSDSRHWQRR